MRLKLVIFDVLAVTSWAVGFRDLSDSFSTSFLRSRRVLTVATNASGDPEGEGGDEKPLTLEEKKAAVLLSKLEKFTTLKGYTWENEITKEVLGPCKAFGCQAYAFDSSDSRCQCTSDCWAKDKIECCEDYFSTCMPQVKTGDQTGEPATFLRRLAFWTLAGMLFVLCIWIVLWLNRDTINLDFDQFGKENPLDFSYMPEDTTLLQNCVRMRFQDEEVERMWKAWNHEREIVDGARGLIASFVFCIIGQICNLTRRYGTPCLGTFTTSTWIAWIGHFLFLCCLLCASIRCVRAPDAKTYWTVVLAAFLYVPAASIEPLGFGCQALAACRGERVRGGDWISEAFRLADCGMQGSTLTQGMILWILVAPWVVHRYQFMVSVNVYVIVVGLGWSLVHRAVYKEAVSDWLELAYWVLCLLATVLVSARSSHRVEKCHRTRFVEDIRQREYGRRMFGILEYMLPEHVIAPMLVNPSAPIAEFIDIASVLYIDILDVHARADSMTPSKLMDFLNEQFKCFDEICLSRHVMKIETSRDKYVACVGALPEDVEISKRDGHAVLLQRLFEVAGSILLRTRTENVRFRMGIHTGPAVAGVIGTKLPRYRLFGDAIDTALLMMQKGSACQVLFGQATFDHLPQALQSHVLCLGEVEIKGKDKMHAYTFSSLPRSHLPACTKEDFCKVLRFDTDKDKDKEDLPCKHACLDSELGATVTTSILDELQEKTCIFSGKRKGMSEACRRFDGASRQFAKNYQAIGHFGILSQREGFTADMEEDWFRNFHQRVMMRKATRRFGQSALLLMWVTGLELVFMHDTQIWIFPHAYYDSTYRGAVFAFTRFTAIFSIILWWFGIEKTTWFADHPRLLHILLVMHTCVCMLLVFASYDALCYSENRYYRKLLQHVEERSAEKLPLHQPKDSVYLINFLLVYHIFTRIHPLLFRTSLCFIVLTAGLVSWCHLWNFSIGWTHKDSKRRWESPLSQQTAFLLVAQTCLNVAIAHADEEFSRARYKAKRAIDLTHQRTQGILDSLMPPMVLEELCLLPKFTQLPSHPYRHATIAQANLCGFARFATTHSPTEIVRLMGELFGAFDKLTDIHGVYKVETVGGAYIAGMAEAPLTSTNSPLSVVKFGLDIVRATDDWSAALGEDFASRVGIHYGECIGGVVGRDMQRYHIFGDYMSVLELLESTSTKGKVHVSLACKEEVERELANDLECEKDGVEFLPRDAWNLTTSKGERVEISEIQGASFFVGKLLPPCSRTSPAQGERKGPSQAARRTSRRKTTQVGLWALRRTRETLLSEAFD